MSMIGYKAMNPDMTCRGFKYEIGKTYKIEGKLKICGNGFHFCKELVDCFKYYDWKGTRIFEVEAVGDVLDDKTKSCTNEIRILREVHKDEYVNGDYIIYKGKLRCINKKIKNAVIPEGVTSIEDRAFWECFRLESIVIPDSVKYIGRSAFYECTSLKAVVIPEGVTIIEDKAFYECMNLESVVIPDSVMSIGRGAFYRNKIKSVTISKSTNIHELAFSKCNNKNVPTILRR